MTYSQLHIICPNPALEITYKVDSLQLGELTDAEEIFYALGGKAVNVSRILTNCNIKHILFCPLGGQIGDIIKSGLSAKRIEYKSINVEEETRVSIVLNDGKDQKVIRTNGNKSLLNYDKAFISQIKTVKESPSICVLSGSLPMFLSSNFYTQLMQIDIYKKTKFFVDTSKVQLKDLIRLKPFCISPNKAEVECTLGYKLLTTEDVIKAIHTFIGLGAVNVIITLGADGAICMMNSTLYRVITYADENLVVNSIGAGDALVAGLVDSELKSLNTIEYLRNAFAFALTSIFYKTSGTIEVKSVSSQRRNIEIQILNENKK